RHATKILPNNIITSENLPDTLDSTDNLFIIAGLKRRIKLNIWGFV
ncbi:hypothetical protein MHK_009166, partial [Candidatus Magnetomorum sp. HK-1]